MTEVFVVFILFVLLPAVLLYGIKEIKKVKGTKVSSGGGELRASELRAIIREAVEDAIEPLSTRVADLEERLGDESVDDLRARLDPALLADAIEQDLDTDDVARVVARRTRS